MDVLNFLDKLRSRQGEILAQLPPGLRNELAKVTATIEMLETATKPKQPRKPRRERIVKPEPLFDLLGRDPEPAPATLKVEASGGVPLSERKVALVEYLKQTGGANRRTLLVETAIPAGSLSALLTRGGREGWLIRDKDGLWSVAA